MVPLGVPLTLLGLVASLPHALAVFNIAVPANSTTLYFGPGFFPTEDRSMIAYTPELNDVVPPDRNSTYRAPGQLQVYYPGGELCVYGEFEPVVVLNWGGSGMNWTMRTENTKFCVSPPRFQFQWAVTFLSGVKAVSHATFDAEPTVPGGVTIDPTTMSNVKIVENGRPSNNSVFTTGSVQVEDDQIVMDNSSSVIIKVPPGTAYFVLRGSGGVYDEHYSDISLNHPWPNVRTEGTLNLESAKGKLWKPQFLVGADSPLFPSPLDPTLDYIISIAGGAGNYRLASVDFYTLSDGTQPEVSPAVQPAVSPAVQPEVSPALPKTDKSTGATPIGAIVGGVIAGVVALGLAGGLLFWMLRKKKGGKQAEADITDKFVVDSPVAVATFRNDSSTPLTANQSHTDHSQPSVCDSSATTSSGTAFPTKPSTKGRAPVRAESHVESQDIERVVFRHDSDAGALVPVRDVLLPPAYNPSWGGSIGQRTSGSSIPESSVASTGGGFKSGGSRREKR